MNIKKTVSRKIFEVCNAVFCTLFVAVALYPLFNQLAFSLSTSLGIMSNTITIFPADFTLDTYKSIMEDGKFWGSYGNTIKYTAVGTAVGLAMTTICSYALSKPQLVGRVIILRCIVFTMFFAGGLIPSYILIKNLGMLDTIWAIVIPGAIAPYNVLLMRTYFAGLPSELEDAASIDGLSQIAYFLRIALPLSKPIIATITLFVAVGFWNDWFAALIYLNNTEDQPITLYLRNLLMGANLQAQSGDALDESAVQSAPQSLQAASLILVIFPVLCLYPFVQKHFTKGVMIGAIKG